MQVSLPAFLQLLFTEKKLSELLVGAYQLNDSSSDFYHFAILFLSFNLKSELEPLAKPLYPYC